jgi:hypothetical protein
MRVRHKRLEKALRVMNLSFFGTRHPERPCPPLVSLITNRATRAVVRSLFAHSAICTLAPETVGMAVTGAVEA